MGLFAENKNRFYTHTEDIQNLQIVLHLNCNDYWYLT